MSLNIDLKSQLEVSVDESNFLVGLPVVRLSQSDSNIPHVFKINYTVAGSPVSTAQQIRASYSNAEYLSPLAIDGRTLLSPKPCKLEQSLQDFIDCTFRIIVWYYDSDSQGQPVQSILKSEARECRLISAKNNVSLERNTTMTQANQNSSNKVEPQNLTSPDEYRQKNFLGWFAIDFGTSNSTVTLYDPNVVHPPQSLPREQEECLHKRLKEWLESPAKEALPSVSESEWDKFISDLTKDLSVIAPQKIGDAFDSNSGCGLLIGIRRIEFRLSNNQSQAFRRAASKRLNRIYHEVFRVPPLAWQSLIPVELDATRRTTEILSEMEITEFGNPLKVLMGERARQNRKQAIAQIQAISDINEIRYKYQHSPKRYFGEDRSFEVMLGDKRETVTVNQLIQAAWAHLIQLTDASRQRDPAKFSDGRFNTVVVTYPTVAPPIVRRQIEQLVGNLGISSVQTAYDEAVAVAIFFLFREFGGDLNIGIESFKTRCRTIGNKWYQNVLVLDIGGGTTDIALMNLTLEEIDPFTPGEDRGAGGRYYKLTPRLLGSSGHLQLGGELITLKLFQLLKIAIADCVLTAVTTNNLKSRTLEDRISQLNDKFLDKEGKFVSKSLLQYANSGNSDALSDADKVIPTRWDNKQPKASCLAAFDKLWEYAENAKLTLGRKSSFIDESSPIFNLSSAEIFNLLMLCGVEIEDQAPTSIFVTLDYKHFEKAVTPVIRDAILLAKGLLESRLTKDAKGNFIESVDWLILSGKTCNLDLVWQQLHQEFGKEDYFIWNSERVTFVPEFSKLATSVGACYAEKLYRHKFNPEKAKGLLRKGANQLDIDVKNLLYFLPCSFVRKAQGADIDLFKAGCQLYQLSPQDNVVKARSTWEGAQLAIEVYRQDYKAGPELLWGGFNGELLARRLGISDRDFEKSIETQFEIDHRLQFKLLLCRDKPHYLITPDIPSCNVAQKLTDSGINLSSQGIFADGKLICDIAIHIAEMATVFDTENHTIIFEAEKDYSDSLRTFRYGNADSAEKPKGIISANDVTLSVPASGKLMFHFRHPNSEGWKLIGEIEPESPKTDYSYKYRVTLDLKGILRLHVGEVPYWTSDQEAVLRDTDGCVYCTELELKNKETDDYRDPFSGKH